MHNRTTLVVLAAGLGSRYGGIKQMDSFGPGGEALMEYNIYDARKAGFNKIVYVLRQEILEDFKSAIGNKYSSSFETEYVIQTNPIKDPETGITIQRSKPWGTGHAMLCAMSVVDEPFAVINADDYYGVSSFSAMYEFLNKSSVDKPCAMIGYELQGTLSPHGTVSRGIC